MTLVLQARKGGHRFAVERHFNASPDVVWRFWTEPELVQQWWGIHGSSIVTCALDVRVDGAWLIDMRTKSGRVYRNKGAYLAVDPERLLVFTDVPDVELPEWLGRRKLPGTQTVTFSPIGSGTHVHLAVELETAAERDLLLELGMDKGLTEGLERLEARLTASGS